MKTYQIIKFKDGDFTLDVNISPEEETVWLSKEDIAQLFDRDRSVIGKHINNIFKEGELSKEISCANFALKIRDLSKMTSVGNFDRSTNRPTRRKLRRNYSVCKKCTNSIPKEGTN